MISLNRGLRSIVTSHFEKASDAKKILWLYSGEMPTAQQVQSLLTVGPANPANALLSNSLKTLANTKGALRLSAAWPANLRVNQANAIMRRWGLEDQQAEFTTHSLGSVGWFLFMYTETFMNEPTYTNNANVYQAIIGTVGDIGSGADLELLGAVVESDKIYRITDVELRIP